MEPLLYYRPIQSPLWQIRVDREAARTVRTLHMHDAEELLFITSPTTCRLVHNGKDFFLQGPALVLNRSGTYHETFHQPGKEPYRSQVIFFHTEVLGKRSQLLSTPLFADDFFFMELTQGEAERFQKYYALMEKAGGEEARQLLFALLASLTAMLREGHAWTRAASGEDYLFLVIRDLIRDPTQSASAEALAPRYHVSPSKLKEDFRRVTETNIKQFSLRLRLERAMSLLSLQGGNIAQIAQECGFTTESHFIAAFRRFTGVTPGQYRKQLKSGK